MTGDTGRATPVPRILFVHNCLTTFVRIDRDLLRERFPLSEACFERKTINLLEAWRAVRECDLVFGWFASWHTFGPLLLARLLGKPSLLVIGGYDLARLPEIGYGHQRGGLRRWSSRATMRLANSLVTNAYFSRDEAERNAGLPPQRVNVIYHGLPDPLGSLPPDPRARMALTVGNVDQPNLRRKGLQPFVQAAGYLPDVEFVVIGAWKDAAIADLRAGAPRNVTFTGRVDDAVLLDYYRQASVYVQASLHEGFGLSVAEAMLAGCIPVVTRVGALPEVVADCGVYAQSPAPSDLSSAIQIALGQPSSKRQNARQRILTEFSLEKRRAALYAQVEALTVGKETRHASR